MTLKSLADGIEETSVQALISPPTGPPLLSSVGDIEGFVHTSLTTPPKAAYSNPTWSTSADIDFAGNVPTTIVRIGTGDRYGTCATDKISTSTDLVQYVWKASRSVI